MLDLSLNTLIRRVDLLTLKLFLTIIEEKHLGRAAARENIAASAVTKRIQDFEEVIGFELFYREPRGVVLSPVGQAVAVRVRQIFANLSEIRSDISDFRQGVRGHIRLGTTESIIVEFLAEDIGEFLRLFPDVEVEICEARNPEVHRSLIDALVDIAVYAATEDLGPAELRTYPYRQDRLIAILPRAHPMASKQAVLFEELLGWKFVGLSATTSMMTQLQHAATLAGKSLHIEYQVASNEAARALVRAGLGIAIQPEGLVTHEDQTRLAVLPLLDKWAVRSMCAAIPNDRTVPAAARALLDHLRSRVGFASVGSLRSDKN
jgi:DNA-binding transcriptional LysR family regulator